LFLGAMRQDGEQDQDSAKPTGAPQSKAHKVGIDTRSDPKVERAAHQNGLAPLHGAQFGFACRSKL
jgi:hypothetical protein